MHRIGADDSNEFAEAGFFSAHLLHEAQQHESDQRHGDLATARTAMFST